MAIRYFINEEKQQVIGLLENTKWDALSKIEKMVGNTDFCVIPKKKYMMPSRFKVTVTCDPRDMFDPEIGKRIAKKRILDRYYKSLDQKVDAFRIAALELNGKIFETPAELEEDTPLTN